MTSTIASLVNNQLNQYLSQGLLTGPAGPSGASGLTSGFSGPNGMVQNGNGQTTSVIGGTPIVSYIPASQGNGNYTGASLAGFGSLSAGTFSSGNTTISGNLDVSGPVSASSLTSSGGATIAGAFSAATSTLSTLTVSGPATFNGSTTIAGLTVIGLNPGLTQGSIAIQGTSGLSQDNANLFYDATNHRLGLGTTTPSQLLTVAGNAVFTGNVGIGTSTPQNPLTVVGNALLSGNETLLGQLAVSATSTLATTRISNLSLVQHFGLSTGGLGFDASGIAKGGLIAGTGSGTFGLQAAGANGLCLVASSTTDSGLTWQNCASASGAILSLNGQSQATQTFATGTDANITLTVSSAGGVHTFTPGFTGQLSVSRGGTGTSTAGSAGSVAYWDGSILRSTLAGSQGQFLMSNGINAPSFTSTTTLFGGTPWLLGGNSLSATGTLGTLSNNDLNIITNSTTRITVLGSNGNVGIGSTSPSGALVVQPASDSTSAVQFVNHAGASVLNVDTTNARVSIGTASARAQLDVAGKMQSTAVGSVAVGSSPVGFFAEGQYAYVGDGTDNKLRVVDISNPDSPTTESCGSN